MRVQAIFLVGLMVGLGACAADEDTGTGGTAGTAGTAGSGGSGNGGSGNGGSGNGGSGNGGSGNGGSGGSAAGGTGGTTGGSGGAATGGTGGTTGGTGGAATGGTGGAATGGTGGAATGGTGGAATGGTGGAATGGAATGGTGGAATGGAATGGTGGAATGGTGGSGGTTPVCTAITASNFARYGASQWIADIDPELGTATVDGLVIEFYGASAGTTNLATAPDNNYATCERCVRVVQDAGGSPVTHYYQTAGSMTLANATGRAGSISNVTLVEVTYDSSTAASTPVAGGKCLTIASASWADAANSCVDGGPEYTETTSCDDCQDAEYASGGCCESQATACGGNAACGTLITCVNGCSDQACYDACAAASPGGVNDLNGLFDCVFGPTVNDLGACGNACQ